jgi:hypothetical protein
MKELVSKRVLSAKSHVILLFTVAAYLSNVTNLQNACALQLAHKTITHLLSMRKFPYKVNS